MTYERFKTVLRLALFAAVAASGFLDTARAALVVGRFDPPFGVELDGAGFRGSATFSIADSCLNGPAYTSGAFIYANYDCDGAGPGTGAGMNLQYADVDFYDIATPSTLLGTVHFGASSAIQGMYVMWDSSSSQNRVIGVQSEIIGPAPSDLPSFGSPDFFIRFGLLYTGDDVGEDHPPGPPDGDNDLDDFPVTDFQTTSMYRVSGNCADPRVDPTVCTASNPAPTVYSMAVPEPGSIALVLGALVAGWSVRRQRR